MKDIRNALRQWGRTPLVTALAALSLTLGIASTLALFGLVDALLLRRLPVTRPDELTRIVGHGLRPGELQDIGVPTRVWQYVREHQRLFTTVLAVGTDRVNLGQTGETRYVGCAYVSDNYFSALGVRVVTGRALTVTDDVPGHASAAIISYRLWQREYGGEDVIGRGISLEGHRFTIVGVAPPGFFGLEVGRVDDVIVPLAAQDIIRGTNSHLRRLESSWLQVYGRLAHVDDFEAGRAAIATWYPAIRAATRDGVELERHLPYQFDLANAARGRSFVRGQYGDTLRILLLAVTVLLAIASLNLAMLGIARWSDRRHELGIRVSLGASRAQLSRAVFAESLLLATISGLSGLWIGYTLANAGARFLTVNRFAPVDTALVVALDQRLIVVAVAVTLMSGLITAALPAWRASRTVPLDSMRTHAAGQHGRAALAVMRTLSVVQVALSVALLVSALLLVRSYVHLISRPTGVDADKVLVAIVTDPFSSARPADVMQRIERTRGALATVPGVTAVSAGLVTPLSGLMAATRMEIPGSQALPMSGSGPFNYVLPGFFETLGTPLLIGRDFTPMDVAGGPGGGHTVLIVNQAFANRHYGGFNPIGRTVMLGERAAQIVGVVANVRTMSLREDSNVAMAFGPLAQRQTNPNTNLRWVIRADAPRRVQHGVILALRALDPRISVEFRTISDEAVSTVSRERMLAWLGGLFASIGLLIVFVGIYGTFSYAVTRRRAELGIRIALGAPRIRIITQLLRDAAVVVAVGTGIGLGVARAGAQWMESLVFGLSPRDMETTAIACLAVVVAATIATYIPARRATLIDPSQSLREEMN